VPIRENCARIYDRIHNAAARSHRDPGSIRLIGVSKTVTADRIREAAAAGITDIGENRLQEALSKKDDLRDLPLRWHFIGHLQTNKVRKVVENFDYVQSVDRSELAQRLQDYTQKRLPVLLEVELGNEGTKAGISPAELPRLVEYVRGLDRLELRGLMTVPPYLDDPESVRPYFARLRTLGEGLGLRELSMGMSHDFEVAIEEGATMVRVGTALFGSRS